MAFKFAFLKSIAAWFKSLFSRPSFLRWGKKAQSDLPQLPAPDVEETESSKQYAQHASTDYMDLKMLFRDLGRMNAILETLGRDFLTAMPEGAYKSRLGQIAFLYRRAHEDLSSDAVFEKIHNAREHRQNNPKDWDEWDSANLHEMETMYRHHCRVAPELMEKRARLSYEGREVHSKVLAKNDWETGQVFLEEMIDLQRRIADSKCLEDNEHETDTAYQALLREYIPGARVSEIEEQFETLEKSLKDLLPRIQEKQEKESEPQKLKAPFPATLQMWLNHSMLEVIGFDFNRGGLYETGHNPVEGGTPDDTRLVIKCVDESNFLDSMKSALHEGGHGLYIQGLPRKQWRYQPVGQDLGAAVHESQALLIEMILGRMPEFFDYLAPRVEGLFQKFGDPAMSAENLWRLKTRVKPGPDRKGADEVTYFFHILLRMRLERDLISGRLQVKDLPDAWNAQMHDLLGIEPKNNVEGCLQDVHWFVGKFGYFPSYTLGHMMAAQIFEVMKRQVQDLPEQLSEGNFEAVRLWLNDNIHAPGRLKRTNELIEGIAGTSPGPSALIRHLEDRYAGHA